MTPIVRWLIVANFAVYGLDWTLGMTLQVHFALWPIGQFYSPEFGTEVGFKPWQLLTSAFLHANLMHIGFNMFALWMFGGELERVWGSRRLAMAYFASVVTGALAQLLVGGMFGPSGGPVVGASAGVRTRS